MRAKRSVSVFLIPMLVLLVFGFSMMGCGDSGGGSSNPAPDSSSPLALLTFSTYNHDNWFSTTTLVYSKEKKGFVFGPELASNKPQSADWCAATSVNIGGMQYILSRELKKEDECYYRWRITPVLPTGDLGAPTFLGQWETPGYSLPISQVVLTYTVGRRQFIFHHHSDSLYQEGPGAWAIFELLPGGTMLPALQSGTWEKFYGTMVALQMFDGKTYLFGQSQNRHYWFIQEINSDGTLGTETDNDVWTFFYDFAFPVFYDPLYLDTKLWMTHNYQIIKDRPLKEIVIPGSHDSGMSESDHCYYGNACNTQTQKKDFYDQLNAGVRYFDLRPKKLHGHGYDGKWFTGHFGKVLSDYDGCMGQPLEDALCDIKKFFQDLDPDNKELVIVNFSHCYTITGHGLYAKGEECGADEWKELINGIAYPELSPYMLNLESIGCSENLQTTPYETLIEGGGHIIFRTNSHHDVFPSNFSHGMIMDRCFPIYNEYSNTNNLTVMEEDQIEKLLNEKSYIDDKGWNRLFLLSWTLTLSSDEAFGCEFTPKTHKIIDYANHAKGTLIPDLTALLWEGYLGGRIVPNILFTDNIGFVETRSAIYLNRNLKFAVTNPKMGCWLLNEKGEIYGYGNVKYYGGAAMGAKAVDIGVTPTGEGYWLLDEKGQIYCLGDAEDHCFSHHNPIPDSVAIGVNPNGWGIWILDEKGQIFSFGDVKYYGGAAMGAKAVDIGVTPTGEGYWLLDEKGQIYCLGDAEDHCFSHHNPIPDSVAIGVNPNGWGIWILDEMGRIFSFGDVKYYGGGVFGTAVDIGVTPTGEGYWLLDEGGFINSFGDAEHNGGGDGEQVAVAIGVNPILGGSFGSTTE